MRLASGFCCVARPSASVETMPTGSDESSDSDFYSGGPVMLAGGGGYDGYTAFIHVMPEPDEPDEESTGFGGGAFEGLIAEAELPGAPDDRIWLRELRRTGQAE